MIVQHFCSAVLKQRVLIYGFLLFAIAWVWSQEIGRMTAMGQEKKAATEEAGPSADPKPVGAANAEPAPAPATKAAAADQELNVLRLASEGGLFMYPLYLLSLLAVTMVVERGLGLRSEKVIPKSLVALLGQVGQSKGGFDPRKAYRICQEHPSPCANVIRAMLRKVGRPHSEVENAVKEACDREANRLYANVRWLNVAAAVAPLIGLLGTVQGMIIAFHKTTNLGAGEDKAVALAGGIYIALVTTFAGLCIAIPAAMFSHFYEGRIQSMFNEMQEFLFELLAQVERYEGRLRFSNQPSDNEITTETAPESPPAPPVQRAPVAAVPK